jgi:hypothetical protein
VQAEIIGGKIVDMWFLDIHTGYILENQGIGGPKLLKTTDVACNWIIEQNSENRFYALYFANTNISYLTEKEELSTCTLKINLSQTPRVIYLLLHLVAI